MDMSGAHRLLMCLFCLLNNVLISYCKSVLLTVRHDKRKTCFWKKIAFIYLFIFCYFFSSGGWFVIKIISKRWLKQHTWQDFSLAPMLLAAYLIIWDEGSLFSSVSPSWWVHRAMTTWLLVSQSIIKKGNNLRLSQFQAVCGTVSAVADCLSLFALFRVGAGAAAAGCLLSRFVYCMELSVTSNRTAAGFVSNIFMTVGYAILALLAYLMRDWRHLMLAVSVPGVLLLLFWW